MDKPTKRKDGIVQPPPRNQSIHQLNQNKVDAIVLFNLHFIISKHEIQNLVSTKHQLLTRDRLPERRDVSNEFSLFVY